MSRELDRAVRRFADSNGARIAGAATDPLILADVDSVTPGGAKNGVDALVTVTWGLGSYTVNSYGASYTPVVGDRVLCAYVESQLIVLDRQIGQPPTS